MRWHPSLCQGRKLPTNSSPYAKWSHGPSSDPTFFPLAVWLQDPANAERYRQAGFNTYVGLWEGPTEEQLARLKRAGMKVICEQNEVALRHLDDPTIIGWMHGDEPDNAQSLGARLGWGAPILPAKIVESYRRLRAADPSRPVMLNLGQGVAWDGWYGRGPRSNHPEDYPQYLEGCDLVSFDIYPAVHDSPQVAGKLWFVAHGVERLVQWGGGKKVVWNCLECTRISNPNRKPTPHEVRAEAWMSANPRLARLHLFRPPVQTDIPRASPAGRPGDAVRHHGPEPADYWAGACFEQRCGGRSKEDRGQRSEVRGRRSEVGGRSVGQSVCACGCDGEEVERRHLYLCRGHARWLSDRHLRCPGPGDGAKAEVLDESRSVPVSKGSFKDHFGPWDVHLYRLSP